MERLTLRRLDTSPDDVIRLPQSYLNSVLFFRAALLQETREDDRFKNAAFYTFTSILNKNLSGFII